MRYQADWYEKDIAIRQQNKLRLADFTELRGVDRIPLPPRDVTVQSAPRGILVSWKTPANRIGEIVGWRIFKDNESTLYAEIRDSRTRQHFIETTAGTTPPVVNIFVASINQLGTQSVQVAAQGSALAETGAPAMPTVPPGYNDSGGGGLRNSGGGRKFANEN
jgi:hypothetical protein